MIVLGLTGSIAMGKSTAVNKLQRLCVPVSNADAIVHVLIGPGGAAVVAIDDAFLNVVSNELSTEWLTARRFSVTRSR